MVRAALLVLLASWSGGLAGCSGGLDVGAFHAANLEAYCGYLERCGVVASVEHCTAELARTRPESPSIAAAVGAGTLVYDEDAARACLDAQESLACDAAMQTASDLAACDDVFAGALADGATCAFDRQCTSGRCAVPDCPDACCTGTCQPAVPLPGIDEPCIAFCADGAYCGADSICHRLGPAGAACGPTMPCAAGLYCALATGACTPVPGHGQPCEGACAEIGDVCVNGTCVDVALLGGPCGDTPCSSFYRCVDGTCALHPTRGMACIDRCSDDSWCSDGTCVAPKPDGAACLRGDECSSHFCDGGTCTALAVCI